MDIEGSEYKWFACTSHLKNIKQMVIEFHDIKLIYECLEKIAETHVIVHAHGNNYGEIVNKLPNVIELTFVRRDVSDTWSHNTTCLPIVGLDSPNNPRANDIFLGSQPFQSPRIAIFIEDNWAFGRIAQALSKYANVDVYDWRSVESTSKLWNESWKYYDHIISTSIVITLDYIPRDAFKKIIVLIMHGEFDDPYFCEIDKIKDDVRYGGICMSVVEDMKVKGYQEPMWVPWGVDTGLFPVKYSVSGPIRRIGLIASDTLTDSQYAKNKGYAMFQEICDAVGAEAVYIRGKPEGQIYDDIDLLICCSRVEGGPFGIFEASASGLPVMSTPVGNMKNIDGLVLFTTVDEAVQQINKWNDDITSLLEYTESMTREIRTNWSMKVCVDRFMKGICALPSITLTMTTCKRIDAFKKTMKSLVNYCTDFFQIKQVLVVDDSSTEQDREEMKKLFPFIKLLTHDNKSHAHSLNIIRENVKTDYIFMFEDDWECDEHFRISDIISDMKKNGIDNLITNVFNMSRHVANGIYENDFCSELMTPEYKQWVIDKEYNIPNTPGVSGWPGFSLNPIMIRRDVLDEPFDETIPSGFMEFDWAIRHANKKWYGKNIGGIHHIDGNESAYVLNETHRWWDPK
jgi:hypothetical protein